ncbi:hypothetical protein ACCUM_0745 [Candidatus Accumulibacter phosphatis]|uniref:Uncharacterized protein n=1 Tax=Candidatus Accumulibacter phosphatis TaxID=327160 RepID=A0A5S4ETT3_9PROT|nr:hypothetical protein ACCUM_0745 [Candidatus Accumulibacter phosphatis]
MWPLLLHCVEGLTRQQSAFDNGEIARLRPSVMRQAPGNW